MLGFKVKKAAIPEQKPIKTDILGRLGRVFITLIEHDKDNPNNKSVKKLIDCAEGVPSVPKENQANEDIMDGLFS